MLQASGRGYLLRLAPGQLDAELFAGRLAAARESRRAGDLSAAAASLESALGLWQGVALDGIPGPWAEIVRARLGEQRLTATEEHLEVLLELGRAAEAAGQLTELVRAHPLRERFSGQLMLALYRCGRQAEALAAFADARRVLVQELGIEPGQELRALHARILAADPGLDAAGHAAAVVAGRRTAARSRPVPAQLPADVAAFTGRDGASWPRSTCCSAGTGRSAGLPDAAAARSASRRRQAAVPIAVLAGTAGVGKTALAVRWARRAAAAFPDGQLYVNLRGYDPGAPVRRGTPWPGSCARSAWPGRTSRPGKTSAPPPTAACSTAAGCWSCSTTPPASSRPARCCPAARPAWWW